MLRQDCRAKRQVPDGKWTRKTLAYRELVQQFYHICIARPYQISVNSVFKHIHTTSTDTII